MIIRFSLLDRLYQFRNLKAWNFLSLKNMECAWSMGKRNNLEIDRLIVIKFFDSRQPIQYLKQAENYLMV